MSNFIKELRERGVLRAAGLYIALIWLFLQIADVVFPAFEIPDAVVRYILYGAIGLFLPAMLLAWFYEITSQGLQLESEVREQGAQRLAISRYSHILTVVVLALALAISVFFNVQQVVEETESVHDNISLLIADTVNATGDPIFDGVLEQALAIGLESASFIASYPRHTALKISGRLGNGENLSEEKARLVALREGIKLVVLGGIEPVDGGFELSAKTLDAESGNPVFQKFTAQAENKADVLQAVSTLSDKIREALGDASLEEDLDREVFSAASLDAVSYYTKAQTLARSGKDAEAVILYRKAVEEDPGFGRAFSGLALSEFNLGHNEQAEELWIKALSLMDGMTERERYRTLGLYYSIVTQNYNKAIENYELLVAKFPADSVAHNNLAVVYFFNRQFDMASKQGESVVALYPRNSLFRTNLALYAMYAGEFELASDEADKVISVDAGYYIAYLPQAIAALANGDSASASATYEAMATKGAQAYSLAQMGLADIALWEGRYQTAISILQAGIARDETEDNQRSVEHKLVALATAQWRSGDGVAALQTLANLAESRSIAILVPAARLYVQMGKISEAEAIADMLGKKLQSAARANASLIVGNIKLSEGDNAAAVDALTGSIDRLDSWAGRFDRGRVYAAAGFYAEALADFEICQQRIGEASSLTLDDSPTFFYTTRLHYWLGLTKQHLGMSAESRLALETFLNLRQESDNSALVTDARERLLKLPHAA